MKSLFLHKQILFPRDTGGKIRALNVLKHLARDHDVTYVCNLRPGEEQHLPAMTDLGLRMETVAGEPSRRGGPRFYCEALANLASRLPFSVRRNFDPAVRAKVAELLNREAFDLVICDCVQMALHTIGLPLPASVLFQHNVEAQILQRHAEISRGWARRWYMRGQFRKMERFERDCGQHFDGVIAVSQQDRTIFEQQYGWQHVAAIDTAVDADFFQPDPSAEIPSRVLFLGSMDWMPNQDGVRFFAQDVWPRIRELQPAATFQIVGRNPPASVVALGSLPGIEVVGFVPDVRPYLAQAAVVVVPLLVEGGTRLKIYEAMAMARPVVSTTIGAEGLPIEPSRHFLQADTPPEFAGEVLRLLADSALRNKLGQSANDYVRRHYGSETVARQFAEICQGVVDRVAPRLIPMPQPRHVSPVVALR